MIPKKYSSCDIKTLELRNNEQEELLNKMKQLYDWELSKKATIEFFNFNPAEMTLDMASEMNPEGYKKWQTIAKKCQEAEEKAPWSLTIIGTVGNGKTTLACSLVNEVNRVELRRRAVYTTQSELTEMYKENFSHETLKMFCETYLLVIDEVSNKYMTDFNRSLLEKILNERYSNNRKTVLIGNVLPDKFKTLFDEHIISRLREGITMLMTAPDMRVRGEF